MAIALYWTQHHEHVGGAWLVEAGKDGFGAYLIHMPILYGSFMTLHRCRANQYLDPEPIGLDFWPSFSRFGAVINCEPFLPSDASSNPSTSNTPTTHW